MDRTACVDVPALPLQLALRRRTGRAAGPVAVVDSDRPQGTVLFVDASARRAGVRTGMRHGAALSLAPELRAAVVPPEEVAAVVDDLVKRLLAFTPGVEPSAQEPGVFFLDASGLARLHGPPAAWAGALLAGVADAGLRARTAVGFTRFGVYAAARTAREDVVVFAAADDETRAARAAPLERLGVPAAAREGLAKLGVRTVADLLRLPEDGLRRRFGEETRRLRRFAAGTDSPPLARVIPAPPLAARVALERPETDAARLLFLVKRMLDGLLALAATRGEVVAELAWTFALDRGPPVEERIRPAAPTLDASQILDLVRLRLAALRLPAGVVEASLSATGTPAGEDQLRLFVERPRRDPAAAERAFARLRAEHGEDVVVVARLCDGHLPEEQFAWERADGLVAPRPKIAVDPPLVRRFFAEPVRIPPPESDARLHGPYLVRTRWWTDAPVACGHWFVETERRRLSWVRHVLVGETWFLIGETQ